jgi:hypothetical protein
MKLTTLAVVSLLIGGMANSTCVWAEDDICKEHKPDPMIDAHAKDLVIKLLDGQPTFFTDWNDYVTTLRKDKDKDKTTVQANEAELAVDMHCKDPQDFTLNVTADGRLHGYSIDTWRIGVNNSVLMLAASTDVSKTLADIHGSINSSPPTGVPELSRDSYIADFNRNMRRYGMAFFAIRKPDGSILISKK